MHRHDELVGGHDLVLCEDRQELQTLLGHLHKRVTFEIALLRFERRDAKRQQLNELGQYFHDSLVGFRYRIDLLLSLDGLDDGQDECGQVFEENDCAVV